mmetsp:Transcript_18255/g.58072  ORF Transcript_18255/g.58072 Transcript_18255/m.58072 type:complete len:264 (-) Transcript_18255:173-964(-)
MRAIRASSSVTLSAYVAAATVPRACRLGIHIRPSTVSLSKRLRSAATSICSSICTCWRATAAVTFMENREDALKDAEAGASSRGATSIDRAPLTFRASSTQDVRRECGSEPTAASAWHLVTVPSPATLMLVRRAETCRPSRSDARRPSDRLGKLSVEASRASLSVPAVILATIHRMPAAPCSPSGIALRRGTSRLQLTSWAVLCVGSSAGSGCGGSGGLSQGATSAFAGARARLDRWQPKVPTNRFSEPWMSLKKIFRRMPIF